MLGKRSRSLISAKGVSRAWCFIWLTGIKVLVVQRVQIWEKRFGLGSLACRCICGVAVS